MNTPRYNRFGILGAGRVGQALATALAPHSAAAPLLWGRSPQKLRDAATRADGSIAAVSIDQLATECDIIAIAVSDDAVADVTAQLARSIPTAPFPFVFHVSGRSGAVILEPLRLAGWITAAIHPAMTFTGNPQAEALRMEQAHFAITGSTPTATDRARTLVALLKGNAVEIAEDRRSLYHAGLCHASNHLVTLITGASQALQEAGVDEPAALLAPLVRAALENSLALGFAGLSGPLLRGDVRTVGDHIDTLGAHLPDLLPAYRAMALATLDELDRSASLPTSSTLRGVLTRT